MLTANSFHVQIIDDEIITIYELVPHEGYFIVAMDSRVLGEMRTDGHYQQVQGSQLTERISKAIYNRIENITAFGVSTVS